MSMNTPDSGNTPGFPKRKTLGDCQTDATIIHGLITGLDLLDTLKRSHEARDAINASGAIMCILGDMAERLANDLDALSGGPGHG